MGAFTDAFCDYKDARALVLAPTCYSARAESQGDRSDARRFLCQTELVTRRGRFVTIS